MDNIMSDETIQPINGVIDVTLVGAVPDNDEIDDSIAIHEAINAAVKFGNGTKVYFPKGRYVLSKTFNGESYVISHPGAENIIICGDNAELYIKNPFAGVFYLKGSKNVTIDGFTVKYKTAPWTQGIIEKVDTNNGTFLYRIMEGYDIFSDPRYTNYLRPWGVVLEKSTPYMLRKDGPEHFKFCDAKLIEPLLYEITLQNPELIKNGILVEGDLIVYTNRGLSGSTVAAYRSESITVKNLKIYECGECLFVGTYMDGDIIFDNVTTEIDKGRWIVSNADGVHIQGSRGKVILKNCKFKGLLDDCLNLYQYPGFVNKIHSEYEFSLTDPQRNLPRVNDTLIFFNPIDSKERGRAKVISVEIIGDSETECKVILDKAVANVNCGNEVPQADIFFIADCMSPGSIIKDNTFSKCRRYGLLLKSRDTIVENNVFEDLGGDAINFTATVEKLRGEGPFAENVTICNNKISNICYRNDRSYTNEYASGAAVGVCLSKNPTNIKNVVIKNNTFSTIPQYAVSMLGIDGLTIINNEINRASRENTVSQTIGCIYLSDAENVNVTDNILIESEKSANSNIYINKNCNNISISNNQCIIQE